jgi:hypothetical protein
MLRSGENENGHKKAKQEEDKTLTNLPLFRFALPFAQKALIGTNE